MATVVVAGHVCLDLIPHLYGSPDLAPGTLVEVGEAVVCPGGAVANVGIVLDRLGIETRMVALIGDDSFAAILEDALAARTLKSSRSIKRDPSSATSYSVVLSPEGRDRTFLHHPGANRGFSSEDVTPEDLKGADWLHFGYPPLLETCSRNGGEELVKIFRRAKSAGLITSLDMSYPDVGTSAEPVDWVELLRNVLNYVDYFMPSLDEIRKMLGMPNASPSDIGSRLWELGASRVIIKMGDQGLSMRDDGKEYLQPIHAASVVGTTGSGDATIAGFICARLGAKSLPDSLEFASAVGSLSCEAADATSGVTSCATVEERLRS